LNQRLLPIAIIAIFGNVLGMGTIGAVFMYGVIVSLFARIGIVMAMRFAVVMEMLRLSSQQ